MTPFRLIQTALLTALAAMACTEAPATGDESHALRTATTRGGGEPNAFIIKTRGGPTETISGLVSEDPPGVLEDCTATASDCGASCSVVGHGDCSSGSNFAACTVFTTCTTAEGEGLCKATTTVTCPEAGDIE